ncbi:MAG TPA: ankyrin repeat domain-containing protein [Pyrinomonadaceae bacterium]|nr:ankyrin repeat domain-containing protein [Pyrinomonadaceae bacterium]
MALTQTHSNLEGESPQYAYALAILCGGVAFIAPQIESAIPAWLSYALLAALFASIWPYKSWQWAVWLCLPLCLLILFDMISTGNPAGVLLDYGTVFAKSLSSACLGAYVGSKLSVRKLGKRPAHRRGLKRGGKRAPTAPVLKESATLTKAIEPASNLQDLNAALTFAVQEGDLNRIRLLIAKGADVNAESSDQWTPPVIAAQGFDMEAVKTLFGQGKTLCTSVGSGWTALMIATIEGHLEVVRVLLEHGARVNAENDQGWTALRFAVSLDDADTLRTLLDAGADANIPDHEGKTALMQAAGENISDSLKMLLEAGADPYIKDHNGQTALMIAETQCHTEIIKHLREAEAPASIDARVSLFA